MKRGLALRAAAGRTSAAGRTTLGRRSVFVAADNDSAGRPNLGAPSSENDVGMDGTLLGDVMKSAAGGAAVPGWVPASPELESVLKVLASDSVVISDRLLVEKYGEALFAATGFTKRAEVRAFTP